ncbi:MAG: hypothetical protein BGO68_02635 [Candidatus Amoebophilus sp. 36-38]|nr:MAG: hypothetical protein BGO68_02635 [Candidatus Amoebophilus sp. 36-38]
MSSPQKKVTQVVDKNKKPFERIMEHIKDLEDDFAKFYDKGNKTAGTRIRKGMQELKEMAQSIRLDVQNRKNATTPSSSKKK